MFQSPLVGTDRHNILSRGGLRWTRLACTSSFSRPIACVLLMMLPFSVIPLWACTHSLGQRSYRPPSVWNILYRPPSVWNILYRPPSVWNILYRPPSVWNILPVKLGHQTLSHLSNHLKKKKNPSKFKPWSGLWMNILDDEIQLLEHLKALPVCTEAGRKLVFSAQSTVMVISGQICTKK